MTLSLYISKCWKSVVTIVSVLAIAGTLTAFYSSLVFQSELEAAEARIQKSIELRDNIYQLNNINENITRVRVLLETKPKNKYLVDELDELKARKQTLQKTIEGNKK